MSSLALSTGAVVPLWYSAHLLLEFPTIGNKITNTFITNYLEREDVP